MYMIIIHCGTKYPIIRVEFDTKKKFQNFLLEMAYFLYADSELTAVTVRGNCGRGYKTYFSWVKANTKINFGSVVYDYLGW